MDASAPKLGTNHASNPNCNQQARHTTQVWERSHDKARTSINGHLQAPSLQKSETPTSAKQKTTEAAHRHRFNSKGTIEDGKTRLQNRSIKSFTALGWPQGALRVQLEKTEIANLQLLRFSYCQILRPSLTPDRRRATASNPNPIPKIAIVVGSGTANTGSP